MVAKVSSGCGLRIVEIRFVSVNVYNIYYHLVKGSFHADSPRASQVTISDFYEIFSTGTSIYMMNTCNCLT